MLDQPIQVTILGPIAPVAQAHAQSTVVGEGYSVQFFDDSTDANAR